MTSKTFWILVHRGISVIFISAGIFWLDNYDFIIYSWNQIRIVFFNLKLALEKEPCSYSNYGVNPSWKRFDLEDNKYCISPRVAFYINKIL